MTLRVLFALDQSRQLLLGALDHRQRHPVFHASRRVGDFVLDVNVSAVGRCEFLEFEEGGISNH